MAYAAITNPVFCILEIYGKLNLNIYELSSRSINTLLPTLLPLRLIF